MLQKFKRSWFALRNWRDRRAVRLEAVGLAHICWNPRHLIYVRAYYHYCVDLFRAQLLQAQTPLQLIFGEYPAANTSAEPKRRIGFQIEHTLVKPGGGDSAGAPVSRTPLSEGAGYYLARVLQLEQLSACDLVIEYSHANQVHLRQAGSFEAYLSKLIVIAPLLYPPDFTPVPRPYPLVTLFSDVSRGRRATFMQRARAAGLAIRNIKRCFDPQQLRGLYRQTRILINLRQSDHHDTFEELRVLPALLCGVLVISEDVPLRECIPYAPFVIWSSLEDLPATIASVQADYSTWHARIFADPALPLLLANMAAANQAAVAGALRQWGA